MSRSRNSLHATVHASVLYASHSKNTVEAATISNTYKKYCLIMSNANKVNPIMPNQKPNQLVFQNEYKNNRPKVQASKVVALRSPVSLLNFSSLSYYFSSSNILRLSPSSPTSQEPHEP